MKITHRLVLVATLSSVLLSSALAYQSQPPQRQDEYVPVDVTSRQEQIPAAPLLIAAYGFFILALFGYLVSISRRMTTVQRDLQRLESRSFAAEVDSGSEPKTL